MPLPPPPHLSAVHVQDPPVLDGRLDDAAWRGAPASLAFTQKAPVEGGAATEKTIVRVVYDDDALYVGVDCQQTGAPVVARLTRRDREVEADWVSVTLDTRGDAKSAFIFEVNAGGSLLDGVRFNDTDGSLDWDENWEAKVTTRADGWSAEYRIPFRILRFTSAPVQSWGFEVRRYVSNKQETDEWSLVPRSEGGEVSHYGKLDDLRGLQSRTPFELRPFVLGRVRRQDATTLIVPTLGNTTTTSNQPAVTDFTPSVGLDLKWHPTQDLTLDGTINPDFAQVEADQLVLNLTTIETYYPEKRPFFLEGTEGFATPFQMLYTRRIGRIPSLPALRPNENLLDVPQPTTIYGASKLTGRIADGWSVGTLQAMTAPATIPVAQADGSHVTRVIAPLTAWNVVHLRREIGDHAFVNAMVTGVTRAEHTTDWPTTPPAIGQPPGTQSVCPLPMQASRSTLLVNPGQRCFDDAYTASVDGRWRSPGGEWAAQVEVAATTLANGPARLVPDGTAVHPGDLGTGALGYLGKEGGEHWVGDVWAGYNDRKFDNNDIGYNGRGNVAWDGFDAEYRTLQPSGAFLETHTRLEYWDNVNMDGLLLGRGAQINTAGKLSNFWHYFFEVHARPTRFDDREMGDGAALERADVPIGNDIQLASDTTKPLSFNVHAREQYIDGGGFNLNESAGVTFHVLPELDLELGPSFTWNHGEPRYVTPGNVAGQYVFGHLDAKSLGSTLRATYTFSPRLSLIAYSQLFLASGHYAGFLSYTGDANGPRPVVHLADMRPVGPPASNPDFEQAALNVNLVLRWEWRLGSLLYLVYTRAQVPYVSLGPGEIGTLDLGSVGRAPAADAFIAKLSYWWG